MSTAAPLNRVGIDIQTSPIAEPVGVNRTVAVVDTDASTGQRRMMHVVTKYVPAVVYANPCSHGARHAWGFGTGFIVSGLSRQLR